MQELILLPSCIRTFLLFIPRENTDAPDGLLEPPFLLKSDSHHSYLVITARKVTKDTHELLLSSSHPT